MNAGNGNANYEMRVGPSERHYNEFLESHEKVSTRVLRDKLLLLQEGGIITREPDHIKRSRIRYSLTEKGIALAPMMVELILWSMQFDSKGIQADFLEKLKSSNKSDFKKELSARLR